MGAGKGRKACVATAAALLWAVLPAAAEAANGTFERTWGEDVITGGTTDYEICTVAADCKAGDAGVLGGELDNPIGIATDAGGNVYVADRTNDRIQKFDSSGGFLRAWGKDVDSTTPETGFEICTVAANCKTGEQGGLGGEMAAPIGVAVDGAGSVYVAEQGLLGGNERIQKFSSSGTFLRAWGKDVDSTTAETGFEICTVAANCQGGTAGTLGGELGANVTAVEADVDGNVYVADQLSYRIQRFDSSGNFLRAWGKDVDTAVGTGFEVCTVAASCKAGVQGGLGGELNLPTGIGTDPEGDVYVGDQSNHRVQKFDPSGAFQRAWGKDVDTAGGTGFELCVVAASCKAGVSGGLGGEFSNPGGIAVDPDGEIYVADRLNQRIQKFTSQSTFLRTWGEDVDIGGGTGFEICTDGSSCKAGATGGLGGELNSPFDVAADAGGNLYVADQFNNRVQRFADPDADADGIPDASDNCPATPNPAQANRDGDALGNACDPDDDNDGVNDGPYDCPLGASNGPDTDGDGCKNTGEDADDDGDLVPDGPDNCPLAPNADQADADSDGIGDACDAPSPPAPEPPADGDTAAPDTTITKGPKAKTKKKNATFEFTSSEPGSTFQCKLDDGAFESCTSPHELKAKKGKHTLSVRATDTAGNVDPSPATFDWKVKKRK